MFESLKQLTRFPKSTQQKGAMLSSDDDSSDDDIILPTKKKGRNDKMQQIIKKRTNVLLDVGESDDDDDGIYPVTKKRMTMNDVKITPPKQTSYADKLNLSLSFEEENDDIDDVPLSPDKVEWEDIFTDVEEKKNNTTVLDKPKNNKLTQAPKDAKANDERVKRMKQISKAGSSSSDPSHEEGLIRGFEQQGSEHQLGMSAVSDDSEPSSNEATDHSLKGNENPTNESKETNKSMGTATLKQQDGKENIVDGNRSSPPQRRIHRSTPPKKITEAVSVLEIATTTHNTVDTETTNSPKVGVPVKSREKNSSPKEKALKTNSPQSKKHRISTESPAMKSPSTTSQKKQRRSRQKAIVSAKEESIQVSHQHMATTEKNWKQKQEAQKRVNREIKMKEQELENLRKESEQLKTEVDAALQEKRQSAKDYKKLTKLWEKVESELANDVAKAAVKAAAASKAEIERELKKQKAKTSAAITPSAKKSSKKKNQRGKANSNRHDEDDESSSASELNDSASDSDDSDWEGAKRLSSSNPAMTPTNNQRGKRCRRQDWSCSACTFLNPLTETKCSVCKTQKPGTVPDDFDES